MVDVFEGKKRFQTILTEFSDLFWQNVFRLQQQFTRVRDAILLTQHFLQGEFSCLEIKVNLWQKKVKANVRENSFQITSRTEKRRRASLNR